MKKRLPFTALELVLVITIAAILLSISLPAFYSISQGRRLTGAMTAIAANVSLARARAVSGNTYIALVFFKSDGDSDSMRLAEVRRKVDGSDPLFAFVRWPADSAWEGIEDGVVIPAGSDNFFEGSSGTAPHPVASVNFLDINGEDKQVTAPRAIIFTPRGQIVTVGSEVTPIVIRAAEGTKVPGSSSYTLKKTDGKVTYARLTINPLTCRTEVDYVEE